MNVTFQTLKKHFPQFSEGFYTHQKVDFEFAHEIIRLGHTGWYTNDFGDLCNGIVVTLPPMPGFSEGRFMAGYYLTDNGETVVNPELYADKYSAVMDADRMAERYAEVEREYQEKWQAAREIEDKIEESEKRLIECIALRHKKCMGYIRAEIVRICEKLRDLRRELKTDYAGVL